MIIDSPIFNDLFIWSLRITKKGRPESEVCEYVDSCIVVSNVTLGMKREYLLACTYATAIETSFE